MTYLTYLANECRDEAKSLGTTYIDSLDTLVNDIRKKQSIAMFRQFPFPFLVKKKFGSFQGRLIAAKEIITVHGEEYAVIKLLSILVKSNHDYDDFQNNPERHGDKYLRRCKTNDIIQYFTGRLKTNPPEPKPEMTEDEQSFLFASKFSDPDYELKNEDLIYESENWIELINSEPYSSYMEAVHETVYEIVTEAKTDDAFIPIKRNPDYGIIFFRIPERKAVFLAELYKKESATGNELVDKWNIRNFKENLIKIARRSYPQYLLGDFLFWKDLQRDTKSNFSLSGEEIETLASIGRDKSFPLFIKGRAGSGKSTILQYLFAEYFARYLSYQGAVPPVYFTYNSELLNQAQRFVFGLLKNNHNFYSTFEKFDEDDINQRLDFSFNELKAFLLTLVDNKEKFQHINYINYSKFLSEYQKKFNADNNAQRYYSPDVSWHVIRTYIEGIDIDDYLEPEEYPLIEKDQQTVSPETYDKVYTIVWIWYKKFKEENDLWDDQDLVRYILENDLAVPQFSGIFCDEAQDFTRIEMELIYRLSIFSRRKIRYDCVAKVPFAFAGDELQTLNPTGFRWDALTALFTEKFILSSYPDNAKIPKLNFRELKNNYRSTQNIVNFSNSLQLFRAKRFNIKRLEPQLPWDDSDSVPVSYFDINSADFWNGVRQLNDIVFIIPCNEGDELHYIEHDPILSTHVHIDNGTPDINILSANLSKGLEFNHVVVWNFGELDGIEYLKNRPDDEDISQRLPLEYHINKTYVAISRAKQKLFIADTDKGITCLWSITNDSILIKENIDWINGTNKIWDINDNLSSYIPGNINDFDIKNSIDIRDVAIQFKENGISSGSSLLLRQAARSFTNNKDIQDAKECEGLANIIDTNYLAAGNCFYEGGYQDLAIISFWLDNKIESGKFDGFKKIIEISKLQNKEKAHYLIANALLSPAKESIETCIRHLSTASHDEILLVNKYPNIISEHLIINIGNQAMAKIIKSIIQKNLIDKRLINRLDTIKNNNLFKIPLADLGDMAFKLNDYKLAIEYWDKIAGYDKNNSNYLLALSTIKEFPDNIHALYNAKKFKEIIDSFENYHGETTQDNWFYIVDSYIYENNNIMAFKYMHHITDSKSFDMLNKKHNLSFSSKESSIIAICHKIAEFKEEKNWGSIQSIIASSKNNNINPLYIALALSKTTSLGNQAASIQKPISDFLEREMIKHFRNIPDQFILDVGIAVEKAGRRIDTLKYYEEALNYFTDNEEKQRFAAERWIATKELQAKLKNTSEKLIKERINEAKDMREKYKIYDSKLPTSVENSDWPSLFEYIIKNEMENKIPVIEKPQRKLKVVAKPVEKPEEEKRGTDEPVQKQHIDFIFDKYKFDYYQNQRRLNITDISEGKSIIVNNGEVKSLDYSIVKNDNEPDMSFKIMETPITIYIEEDVIMQHITVRFDETKIAFNFF
ncbi:MAG: hypothetical protein LBQ38_02640 [Spirochaetaceae bacterium]|jgi:hypothetical protein|nr:hypothetical protein [Spirochaetaceae bacterium]